MAEEEDATLVKEMIDSFRAGGAERVRLSNVASRLNFDESIDCLKRKRVSVDGVFSPPLKSKKEDCSSSSITATPQNDSKTATPDVSKVLPVSPWETQNMRRQLAESNLKISDLECQISSLHLLRKEMELVFQKDRESFRKQMDTERSKVRELEDHMRTIRKREGELKEELKETKILLKSDKLKHEEEHYEVLKENSKLKDDIQELQCKRHQEEMDSTRIINELKSEMEETKFQLKEITSRNNDLERRMKEELQKFCKIEELEQQLQGAQLKIKDMERDITEFQEAKTLIKSQQHRLIVFPAMEREIEDLRDRNQNLKDSIPRYLLLEEMVEDLKSRQTVADEKARELAWVQGQMKHLQSVLKEWQSVAGSHFDGAHTEPTVMKTRIGELQQKVVLLTAEASEAKSQFKDAQHKYNLLNVEGQGLKKENGKLKSTIEQLSNRVRLLQRKVQLVQMERDSYRSQLDTYERELTITPMTLGNQQSQHQQQQQQRIETLEKILEGYRRIEKLESDNEKTKGSAESPALLDKVRQVECERDKLRQEKEQLQKHNDELVQQLEYRALKGDFNPLTSKVLHFKMNPAAEAEEKYKDEVEKLKAECSRLRQRIKLLEEGNSQDITQKVEERMANESISPAVEALQETIKSQEIKMQRMKEVYLSSAQEYREVCYELFGYKMDRTHNNIYTLSSMYADAPEDNLMFKRMADGTIDMMETSYSTTLGDLIDLHLHQHNSFPLFLGAINVELFNRQTIIAAS